MIKGDKVILRAVEPGDLPFLIALENDTENWLVSGTVQPFSANTLKQYVESVHDIVVDKQVRLIIETNQVAVGCVDLFDVDWVHRRAGVGIILLTAHRSLGYAADALNVLTRYAKSTLNLHQLYCNIMPQNAASISIFEKAGFIKSAEKLSWIQIADGTYKDEWMYQHIFE